MAVVRKMRSPRTTGEDEPLPGTGVFQRTFSVPDQVVGGVASELVPSTLGPRQFGQPDSAWARDESPMGASRARASLESSFMSWVSKPWWVAMVASRGADVEQLWKFWSPGRGLRLD